MLQVTINGSPRVFVELAKLAKVKTPGEPAKEPGPSAFRLTIITDTPYDLPQDKALFFKKTDAEKYAAALLNGAKERQVKRFEIAITNLYKDADSGRLLPGYGVPDSIMRITR